LVVRLREASTVEAPVTAALMAGSVTAIGWLVSHILTVRREEQRRRTEAQLKFVERQIEDLYGPLAFLLHEGRRTFVDLLDALDRRYVFKGDDPLSEDELRTWL
jgi:hypothetical protein